MLAVEDVQAVNGARLALDAAVEQVEALIDRATALGWTERVGPLRDALVTVKQVDEIVAGLFR